MKTARDRSNVESLLATLTWDNWFDLLPILADALMDAGCFEPQVIDRLKGDGEGWTRGNWVLRSVLGDR